MSKLQTVRKKVGVSQAQLAEKAGINIRTLQHYEQMSKNFDHARMDTILRVCLALDCKIEDIVENQNYIGLLKEYENKEKLPD